MSRRKRSDDDASGLVGVGVGVAQLPTHPVVAPPPSISTAESVPVPTPAQTVSVPPTTHLLHGAPVQPPKKRGRIPKNNNPGFNPNLVMYQNIMSKKKFLTLEEAKRWFEHLPSVYDKEQVEDIFDTDQAIRRAKPQYWTAVNIPEKFGDPGTVFEGESWHQKVKGLSRADIWKLVVKPHQWHLKKQSKGWSTKGMLKPREDLSKRDKDKGKAPRKPARELAPDEIMAKRALINARRRERRRMHNVSGQRGVRALINSRLARLSRDALEITELVKKAGFQAQASIVFQSVNIPMSRQPGAESKKQRAARRNMEDSHSQNVFHLFHTEAQDAMNNKDERHNGDAAYRAETIIRTLTHHEEFRKFKDEVDDPRDQKIYPISHIQPFPDVAEPRRRFCRGIETEVDHEVVSEAGLMASVVAQHDHVGHPPHHLQH